jgi:predicted AAA+ superfamily ATPase
MLDDLYALSRTFIKLRNRPFRRSFLASHPLTARLSIIIGQRGIGKTTAMIQHLLDSCAGDPLTDKALYLQADHFLMANRSLYEIAEEFHNLGGELLCLDEIHKYPDWSRELKSITDTFPALRVVASGSSALEVSRGSHDLSRRAVVHRMYGMSFREYIALASGIELPAAMLPDMLSNHVRLTDRIVSELAAKGDKVLALFRDYLTCGYYPYFVEYTDRSLFGLTLEQHVHTTLEVDLPAIHPALNGTSIKKISRLLTAIAGMVSFAPDLKSLRTMLDISDDRTLKTYLQYLEDAGVILTVSKSGKGLKAMAKPDKIYLNNPNLFYALFRGTEPDSGAMRETFFLNMLRSGYEVTVPQRGDFLVNGSFTFEVGGKGKGFRQVAGIEDSYLALDGIEAGNGRTVPLWLFGFLY